MVKKIMGLFAFLLISSFNFSLLGSNRTSEVERLLNILDEIKTKIISKIPSPSGELQNALLVPLPDGLALPDGLLSDEETDNSEPETKGDETETKQDDFENLEAVAKIPTKNNNLNIITPSSSIDTLLKILESIRSNTNSVANFTGLDLETISEDETDTTANSKGHQTDTIYPTIPNNNSTALITTTQETTPQLNREQALQILKLSEGATESQINKAVRQLALQSHTDKGGNAEQFVLQQAARDVLLNINSTNQQTETLAIENESTRSNPFSKVNPDTLPDTLPDKTVESLQSISQPESAFSEDNLEEAAENVQKWKQAAAEQAAAEQAQAAERGATRKIADENLFNSDDSFEEWENEDHKMLREALDKVLNGAALGNIALVEEGLKYNSDLINGKDSDSLGETPLHMAASGTASNKIEMIEFLLSKGANPNAEDSDGKKPSEYVTDNPVIKEMLKKLENKQPVQTIQQIEQVKSAETDDDDNDEDDDAQQALAKAVDPLSRENVQIADGLVNQWEKTRIINNMNKTISDLSLNLEQTEIDDLHYFVKQAEDSVDLTTIKEFQAELQEAIANLGNGEESDEEYDSDDDEYFDAETQKENRRTKDSAFSDDDDEDSEDGNYLDAVLNRFNEKSSTETAETLEKERQTITTEMKKIITESESEIKRIKETYDLKDSPKAEALLKQAEENLKNTTQAMESIKSATTFADLEKNSKTVKELTENANKLADSAYQEIDFSYSSDEESDEDEE